ncbi:metal ABC transporter solute-binding protein, Zn/Mn family [Actinopolyspora erythraea]|uniref:metal ABC transporter solute-binding protein, Zn/Mn family n=1 Tax=Actinopolyspora erythraea TaxID=414996 RepID=UPI000693DCC7|nr:zinc ABC transporter substrate-binding protein [Actinopolyspora erythraea]
MFTEWRKSRARKSLALLLAVSGVLAGACGTAGGGNGASDGGSERLRAFVSIPPQRYFVERIGGEHVSTSVLLPPAASPALYEPKPSELRSLSGTDVYFAVDVPFERSVADRIRSAGGDDMRWVRTWQDVDRGRLEGGKPDPHIWLSPRRAKTQAETIAAALSRIDPDHEREYRENLRRFEEHVDALDADIASELEPVAGKTFMSFHPAWHYFANDYDLKMLPIESGGKEPGAARLREIIERAENRDIRAVFVQPRFSEDDARTIAEQVGATVEPLDPLARDWEKNMRHVATELADALRSGS